MTEIAIVISDLLILLILLVMFTAIVLTCEVQREYKYLSSQNPSHTTTRFTILGFEIITWKRKQKGEIYE